MKTIVITIIAGLFLASCSDEAANPVAPSPSQPGASAPAPRFGGNATAAFEADTLQPPEPPDAPVPPMPATMPSDPPVFGLVPPGARGIDTSRFPSWYSLPLFQQLVYGYYDLPSSDPHFGLNIRWPTSSPHVWLKLSDANGRHVAHEDWVPAVQRLLHFVFRALTDVPYRGRIDGGMNDVDRDDVITITFDAPPYDTSALSNGACGYALVSYNGYGEIARARISLRLDERLLQPESCSGSRYGLWGTMFHEVAHALGFWHVSDDGWLMYPSATENWWFAPREQFHARRKYTVLVPGWYPPEWHYLDHQGRGHSASRGLSAPGRYEIID